jgi:hypothetical protein
MHIFQSIEEKWGKFLRCEVNNVKKYEHLIVAQHVVNVKSHFFKTKNQLGVHGWVLVIEVLQLL